MSFTLIPQGEQVSLAQLEPGSLFLFRDTLCVKSEYRSSNGAIQATIVGTGESFWGGTSKPYDQVRLKVQPVSVVDGAHGTGINELVAAAHANAVSKGWWDEDRSFGEIIALIHSEASEALEDFREGKQPTEEWYRKGGLKYLDQPDPTWKPCGIPSELADIVIRVFDACGRYGIDLEAAIAEKMAYNATRPQRHGGKVL